MNYTTVLYLLGWLISAFGAFMTVPTLVSWQYHDLDAMAFLQSSVFTMFVGVVLILMNRRHTLKISHRDGFLLTVSAWVILSLLGALPLYFSGAAVTWVDALFEATSGLTTTGATVFTGLDTMGHGILLWRAMLQWMGGMGIIVFAIAVLPFLGVGGMQLYKSEMPGVTKDKLQPRLKETARLLWIVYVALTILCCIAYMLAGMVFFDALCHAFTTIATGGFSTHDKSIGFFSQESIQLVGIVFMFLGAVNFTLHYRLVTGWRLTHYFRDVELRMFVSIFVLAVVVIFGTLYLTHEVMGSSSDILRHTIFNTLSIITTTGFTSSDYTLWPSVAPLMLLLLMFVGGCSGSTSGGMKMMRILLIIKHGLREVKKLVHPAGVEHIKIGTTVVPSSIIQAVWAFAGLYIVSFVLISLAMSAFGLDLVTAFSAAAATITNVGPGLGDVGPGSNYGGLPEGAKLILCFSMLLGRLELFTLLVLFAPSFWRR